MPKKEGVQLIQYGYVPQWQTPPRLPIVQCQRNQDQVKLAREVMREYIQAGAFRLLAPQELPHTQHLIPWFVLSKLALGEGRSVQTQTSGRLQGFKFGPEPPTSFQDGSLEGHLSLLKETLVCNKSGHKTCLFPLKRFLRRYNRI